MFADQIEHLKREYTDKYVLVDGSLPELARFRDTVGRVKTVNMNGRALVEFDDYHLNIGWYDIDPEFLKVVDKPPPKPPKVEAKKAPAKAEAKPAAAKPAATKAPAAKAGRGSVADILAAARAGKATSAAPAAEAPAAAPKKPKPDAPKAQTPAKVDRSKMSVADMLAAARAAGAGGAAPAKSQPAEAPAPEEPATEEPAAEAVETPPAAPAGGKSIQRVDKSKMSIADMIAYCREHDAK